MSVHQDIISMHDDVTENMALFPQTCPGEVSWKDVQSMYVHEHPLP
jgi:hypothetical protein